MSDGVEAVYGSGSGGVESCEMRSVAGLCKSDCVPGKCEKYIRRYMEQISNRRHIGLKRG